MAISQSISSFFLPNQRRSRKPAAGGRGPVDSATQRLLGGIDGVLEPFNAPDYVTGYLKDDLENAFTVKGPPRPGYEPGRVAPVRFNLIDFFTDPLETTWKTVKTPFESNFGQLVYTPEDFLNQVDKAVWDYLYDEEWGGVVPYSAREVVARWNENNNNPVKIVRDLARRAVRENPGIALMKARALVASGASLKADIGVAERYEGLLSGALIEAAKAKEAGDYDTAYRYWKTAENIQKRFKREGKDLSRESDREFKRLSGKGGPLYNTSEARFMRYWGARDLRYSTLGFLRTWRKDGIGGVVKVYGWGYAKNKIKDFYYATQINDLVNNIAGKLGVTKLLGKMADAQTFVKRLRAGFWIKKGLKKVGTWLIEKLGLASLGAALGSAVPLAGTAIGAIIGAVLQFAAEIVVEKLGEPIKILGYVLAGVIGFFLLFGVGTAVLLSVILGNHPYPWEATAGEIDCNQAATATDACVLPKAVVKSVADRWGVGPGNHVEECYSDVIAKAQSAGVRPDFAMAIWLNESNASNYNVSPADFGIRALDNQGFTAQLSRFLTLPNSYKANYPQCFAAVGNPMLAFMTIFHEGGNKCTDPNVIAIGQTYLDNIRSGAFASVSKCSWPSYPE